MSDIIVLGIDPSLTATGLVRLDEQDGLTSRVVRPRSTGVRRLIDIEQAVAQVAEGVTLVALEGYAFGAQASREALGELGGILKRYLYQHAIPTIIVPPSSVKKFACSRGNAKKDEMRLAVYKKWGVDEQGLRTADEVDAYVLARIALVVAMRQAGREVKLLQYEAEALKSLREVA
ncbi:MAG: hypothetical protein ACM3ZU_08110 [Bacteroidota bacterium]